MADRVQDYLRAVGEQIRWKRARAVVLRELEGHLSDQAAAFAAEGETEETACRRAVEEMGDPVEVGVALDRVHRPRPQWGTLLLALGITLLGGALRVYLTAGSGYDAANPLRTALALVLGGVALVGMYLLDYTWFLRHARGVYVSAVLLGLLALALSPRVNSASYYTRYVVLLYPAVYALWLYRWRGKGWTGFLAALLGGGPLLAVCLLAPYLFGAAQFLAVGAALLAAAGGMDWFGLGRGRTLAAVGALGAAGLCAAAWLIFAKGVFLQRLVMLLHPENDPLGAGYQAIQTRKALAAARLWGSGTVMEGPYSFEQTVPGWNQDLFLTTVVYKLGWGVVCLLLGLLAALLGVLLWKTLRQKCRGGRLLAWAVLLSLGVQAACGAALNMGYVLFSVSPPLVVGNLAAVVQLALVGLALSVFREDAIARDGSMPRGRDGVHLAFRETAQNGNRIFSVSLIIPEHETNRTMETSYK